MGVPKKKPKQFWKKSNIISITIITKFHNSAILQTKCLEILKTIHTTKLIIF